MAWAWNEPGRGIELPEAAWAVLNNWAEDGYTGSKIELIDEERKWEDYEYDDAEDEEVGEGSGHSPEDA